MFEKTVGEQQNHPLFSQTRMHSLSARHTSEQLTHNSHTVTDATVGSAPWLPAEKRRAAERSFWSGCALGWSSRLWGVECVCVNAVCVNAESKGGQQVPHQAENRRCASACSPSEDKLLKHAPGRGRTGLEALLVARGRSGLRLPCLLELAEVHHTLDHVL